MIIAQIKPDQPQELIFEIKIEGSKEEPSEVRFVIESQTVDGKEVLDVFSIICRAVRENDAIKVYIPRLLNLLRAGAHNARLEVVLENRLFIPLSEEVMIEEPISVQVQKETPAVVETIEKPEITVTLTNVIKEMLDNKKVEETVEVPEVTIQPQEPIVIDKSWRSQGFRGIKNPFK